MISAVNASERFWRTPGNRVRRIRPHIYTWGKTKLPKQRIRVVSGAAPNKRLVGTISYTEQLKGKLGFVPGLRSRHGNRISYKDWPTRPPSKWLDKYRVYIKGKPRLTKTSAVD